MDIINSACPGAVKRGAQSALVLVVLGLLTACSQAPRLGAGADTLTPQEHLTLGASYEAQGLRQEAAAQYQAAVRRGPDCAECWLALGNTYYADDQLDAAESAYRKALKAAPHHPGASNNLAMVTLTRHGSLPEAEALAQDALPNAGALRPYVLDTLANIYMQQRRYAEAMAAVEQADAAAPAGDLRLLKQLRETRASITAAQAGANAAAEEK